MVGGVGRLVRDGAIHGHAEHDRYHRSLDWGEPAFDPAEVADRLDRQLVRFSSLPGRLMRW